MIKIRIYQILFLCFTGFLSNLFSQQQTSDDSLRYVLSEYVRAWREGDVEGLSAILQADQGRVYWTSAMDTSETINSMTFADVLKKRKAQPQYGLTWEIESLEIVEDKLAFARLFISHANGNYVDFLTCQKLGGQWKIIHKSFVNQKRVE